MSLYKIQSQLKAPKNQFNKFGGYNYRSQEDILEALKPILAELQYSLVITDDIVEIGGRVYVKANVKLLDAEMKTIAETQAFARESESKKGMDASQVTGATSSYARKYALNGLFLIDDCKDADSMKPENGNGKSEYITEKQLGQLKDYIDNFKFFAEDKFLEIFKAESLEKIPANRFAAALKALQDKARKEAEENAG